MRQNLPEYSLYTNEELCRDKDLCSPLSSYWSVKEASKMLNYKIDCDYQNVSLLFK